MELAAFFLEEWLQAGVQGRGKGSSGDRKMLMIPGSE